MNLIYFFDILSILDIKNISDIITLEGGDSIEGMSLSALFVPGAGQEMEWINCSLFVFAARWQSAFFRY